MNGFLIFNSLGTFVYRRSVTLVWKHGRGTHGPYTEGVSKLNFYFNLHAYYQLSYSCVAGVLLSQHLKFKSKYWCGVRVKPGSRTKWKPICLLPPDRFYARSACAVQHGLSGSPSEEVCTRNQHSLTRQGRVTQPLKLNLNLEQPIVKRGSERVKT